MRRLAVFGALLFVLITPAVRASAAPSVPPPTTVPVPAECTQPAYAAGSCVLAPVTVPPVPCPTTEGWPGAAVDCVMNPVSTVGLIPSLGSVFDLGGMLTGWVEGWAVGILKDVSTYVQKTAGVGDLSGTAYKTLYAKMEYLGGLIGFAAFAVYQFGPRTSRARLMSLGRLAGAGILMPITPMIVSIAYGAVTELTSAVSSGFGGDIGTMAATMEKSTHGLAGWSSAFAFMTCFMVLIGAILVLIQLVLLAVAVPVLVAFMPLFLGLAAHESMIPALKRVIAGLAAAVVGGFVIAVVGSVGAAVLAGTTNSANGVVVMLEGGIILLLAALSPWALGGLIGARGPLSGKRSIGKATSTAHTVTKVAAVVGA